MANIIKRLHIYYKLTNMPCFYCRILPYRVQTKRKHKYIYNGIDRFDNNLEYIKENCVTACWICNRGKNKMLAEEFIFHLKKIKLFQQNLLLNRTRN